MFCYNCGNKMIKSHKFCSKCGTELDFTFLDKDQDRETSYNNKGTLTTLTKYADTHEIESEINLKQEKVSELIAKISDLKLILFEFEHEYNDRVGILYIELEKIELLIKEYQEKIRLIQEQNITNEDEIDDIIDDKFKEERKKVNDFEKRINEEHIEFENLHIKDVDEETNTKIIKLFRELIKKCHPDVVSENKKALCTKITKEITEAYQTKDYSMLQEIANTIDERLEAVDTDIKIATELIKERDQLAILYEELEQELEAILKSDVYKLYSKYNSEKENDKNILEDLEENVKQEINLKQMKLKSIKDRYYLLLDEISKVS